MALLVMITNQRSSSSWRRLQAADNDKRVLELQEALKKRGWSEADLVDKEAITLAEEEPEAEASYSNTEDQQQQ